MPVLFVNDLGKYTNSFNQRILKQNKNNRHSAKSGMPVFILRH